MHSLTHSAFIASTGTTLAQQPIASLTVWDSATEFFRELAGFLSALQALQMDPGSWQLHEPAVPDIVWNYCGDVAKMSDNFKPNGAFVSASATYHKGSYTASITLRFEVREINLSLFISKPYWSNGLELCAYVVEAAKNVIAFAEISKPVSSDAETLYGHDPKPWVLAAQMLANLQNEDADENLLITLPSPWDPLLIKDDLDNRLEIDPEADRLFNLRSPLFCSVRLDESYSVEPGDCLYIDIGSTFSTLAISQRWENDPLAKIRSINAAYQTGMLESIRSQN